MEKVTLSNGLRIMLEPDESVRTACFGVWVAAGSCYETEAESGISHFIEHILFKGTAKRSAKDIAEEMDMLGGQIYAYTAKECTSYYVRTLGEHVEQGFEILCDMLTAPRMKKEDMDIERGVILEEISMSEDEPEDLVTEQMYGACWKKCVYGKEILGTRETVGAHTSEALRAFMEKTYTPSRMVVSVGGRFDRDGFLALCEKYFGSMPSDKPFSSDGLQMEYTPARVLTPRTLEQTHVCLCVPGLSGADPDRYALGMLNAILGGATSSRLFQRIREELGLAYSVYSDAVFYTGGGVVGMYLAVAPDAAQRALEESLAVFRSLEQGVTRKEFDRTKENFKTGAIMGLESVASRVANMGTKMLLRGRVNTADDLLEEIGRVSLDDVNRMTGLILEGLKQPTVSVVGPIKNLDFFNSL